MPAGKAPFTSRLPPASPSTGDEIAILTNAQIIHLGYEKSVIARKNKAQRNIQILEATLAQNPDDLFQIFNLANTYYTDGDYARALPLLERVCKETDPRR